MATIEYDGSYLNSTPGKIKIACLVLSIVGILVLKITGGARYSHGDYFCYIASTAITLTGICLVLLLCIPSLQQNRIFLIVELIICVILTIGFVVATWDVFMGVWDLLHATNHTLFAVIGYIVAVLCGIFSVIQYAYDAQFKFGQLK